MRVLRLLGVGVRTQRVAEAKVDLQQSIDVGLIFLRQRFSLGLVDELEVEPQKDLGVSCLVQSDALHPQVCSNSFLSQNGSELLQFISGGCQKTAFIGSGRFGQSFRDILIINFKGKSFGLFDAKYAHEEGCGQSQDCLQFQFELLEGFSLGCCTRDSDNYQLEGGLGAVEGVVIVLFDRYYIFF